MSHKIIERKTSTSFKEIKPMDMKDNPFYLFVKEWFLMTAEKDGCVNTMTVGWGGIGNMWGKNVVMIAVRPERYTKEFLDASETFSLTVLPNDRENKKLMVHLGTKSGRDEDKIANTNLTVVYDDDTPFFEEAVMSINCKRIMDTQFQESDFHGNDAFTGKWYGGENKLNGEGGGYHHLYIAEIEKILVKE